MPYQQGSILLNGTIDNVTLYKRDGKWLARKKSSLNKKRVSSDPAFEASRAAGKNFGRAARMAKEIYWQLPANEQGHGIIGKITGEVNRLLYGGYPEVEIREMICRRLKPRGPQSASIIDQVKKVATPAKPLNP